MAQACGISRSELALFQSGGLAGPAGEALQSHARTCPRCQSELAAMSIAFRALVRPPPEIAGARQRMISQALSSPPAPESAGMFRWPALAGGLALLAVVLVAVSLNRPRDDIWKVEYGELTLGTEILNAGDVIPKGEEVQVAAAKTALVQLQASRVKLAAGTRLAIRSQSNALDLQNGRVELEVKPRPKDSPFSVSTAEVIVRVVGTRFTVDRAVEGAVPSTSIAVQEGVVEVTDLGTSQVRQLGGGELATIQAPVNQHAVASVEQPPAEIRETSTQAESLPIAEIRSRLRGGQIGAAKKLIKKARLQASAHPRYLPELAVVEAEIFLAEQKHRLAVTAYLDVVKRYPQTPQAEAALIAASQLALDHPDLGFKGMDLLRRYLKRYPNGRFSGDAKELLKAFEPSR